VPANTQMTVIVGNAGGTSQLSYTMQVPNPGPGNVSPVGPTPSYAQWIVPGATFINTGRDPIAVYNYMYDAQCGAVGFEPN